MFLGYFLKQKIWKRMKRLVEGGADLVLTGANVIIFNLYPAGTKND